MTQHKSKLVASLEANYYIFFRELSSLVFSKAYRMKITQRTIVRINFVASYLLIKAYLYILNQLF